MIHDKKNNIVKALKVMTSSSIKSDKVMIFAEILNDIKEHLSTQDHLITHIELCVSKKVTPGHT